MHSNARNVEQSRLRALMVTVSFPPQLGGVQTALYKTCANYDRIDVQVIAPLEVNASRFDRQQEFPIYRVGVVRTSLLGRAIDKALSITFGALVQEAIKFGWRTFILNHSFAPQIIQCGHVRVGLVGYLLKRLYKIPYVIHIHGKEVEGILNGHFIDRLLGRLVYDNADLLLADNEYSKQSVIGVGVDKSRVKKVGLGVDLEHFGQRGLDTRELADQLEIGEHHKVILTVGRLVPKKGQDQVIRALPLVLQVVPNVIYVLVGTGPMEAFLKRLAKEVQVDQYVRFVGPVSHSEIVTYYQLCDLFVMPSRRINTSSEQDVESFGVVYLEANACQKPVVGGKSGGISEAVVDNETGLLVNPDSVEDLSQAIVKLLTDEMLANAMGAFGRQRVEEGYTWQHVSRRVETEIGELVLGQEP